VSIDKADGDERDGAAAVEPLVEKKFCNLTSGLPYSSELLGRLKAIEDCNIAGLFKL
jgi:hypothetical protein